MQPIGSYICVQNMCEHSQWVAQKLKKGCQMWKEDSETEMMVEEKKSLEHLWSPIQVLNWCYTLVIRRELSVV